MGPDGAPGPTDAAKRPHLRERMQKGPESPSVRGSPGHKHLAGAYLRFAGGERAISGVLHPRPGIGREARAARASRRVGQGSMKESALDRGGSSSASAKILVTPNEWGTSSSACLYTADLSRTPDHGRYSV
jgi:hypothetical protein